MACTKETVKRNGLNIWWMGSKDDSTPNVDIVAVQGLGSHPYYTWVGRGSSKPRGNRLFRSIYKGKQRDEGSSSSTTEFMWLRDLLPAKFPNARIATYSYESGFKSGLATNLRRCGDQFLEILRQHRQSPQEHRRPILLLGHSLGGLVIAQALVTAVHRTDCLDLRQAVAGIIFLGVPFDGSNPAQYGELIAQAIGADDTLLRELRRNSETLFDLSVNFWNSYQTWDIVCYYENKHSKYGPWTVQTVQKQSAAIRGKRMFYLQTDHSGLNKFSGIDDENFALLFPEIERIVRDGPKIVSDRYHGLARTRSALPTWLVPFQRNQNFISRVDQFTMLDSLFLKGHFTKLALIGLGGVGKTQIALELAYRVRDQHPDVSVFWFSAMTIESIEQTFKEIGDKLKVPGISEKNADVKDLVKRHLSCENIGPWLMIFDNADDFDILFKRDESNKSLRLVNYIPKSNDGCVVLTTRTREVAVTFASADIIEVSQMEEEVATQLLYKSLARKDILSDRQNIRALLQELTFLPLAIVQAAAYINVHDTTIIDYLSLLQDTEENVAEVLSEDFEDEWRDYKHQKNPVATTWLVSFKQIQDRHPLAAEYLWFMSCLNPKDIPQSALLPAKSKNEKLKAIGTLKSYSFISQRDGNGAFDCHRLVSIATRNWLRKNDLLSKWTETALTRLADILPSGDYANRRVWRTYLPHADYILQSGFPSRESQVRLRLVELFGLCLDKDGRYNEAEEQLQQVVEPRKRVLGEEHPDTLTSMANLASTYRNQGRWNEAEKLEMQVIETSLRVLGEEHPDTLTSMDNLASTYRNQGRWNKAEKLEVQVMETSLRVLGEEHPSTLTSMANLASTYRNQGRWNEAEKLEVQVIETSLRVLGEEHPSTLTSMANLASTYRNQGRWNEAKKLDVQVIETRRRVLGEEHPSTLTSMGNLASTYRNQGRWNEAKKLEVQVIETRRRVLGGEHLDTLTSMGNLASTYWNQGQWNEAEKLEVQVIETSLRVLGGEHPDTLTSMGNLASTYRNQGRWNEAEKLFVQVIETRRRVLGEEHPSTLTSMANLASMYQNQDRWDEAEKLEVRVMETRKRLLGEEHPDTLTSMVNLAYTMKSQDRNKDAKMLMDQCVNLQKMTLGIEHPDIKSSLDTLKEWQLAADDADLDREN